VLWLVKQARGMQNTWGLPAVGAVALFKYNAQQVVGLLLMSCWFECVSIALGC
jgi:hypothetical protein